MTGQNITCNFTYDYRHAYRNSPTGKCWNTDPITKERREKPAKWTLERLFEAMDKARIDKPRILRESFHPLSYSGVPCPITYHTIKAMEKYPDHIVGCSNGGFHLIRGVSDATEELKILNLVRQLNSEVSQES